MTKSSFLIVGEPKLLNPKWWIPKHLHLPRKASCKSEQVFTSQIKIINVYTHIGFVAISSGQLNISKAFLGGCLVPLVFLTPVTSNVWTHAWSVKHRLITKLIAQIEINYEMNLLSLISPLLVSEHHMVNPMVNTC
jgi:hypothetical protein